MGCISFPYFKLDYLLKITKQGLIKIVHDNYIINVMIIKCLWIAWFSFFIFVYREDTGKVRVFSIKIALATMCSGKLMDKLRCKSDQNQFILK